MNRDAEHSCQVVVTDEDIYQAMKEIPGYLDITVGDFREVYQVAFRNALERLREVIPVARVMTRDVVTVSVAAAAAEVAQRMAEQGVSGVPVLDAEGKVAGVISEKDFLILMGAGRHRSFMEVVARCLGTRGCVAAPMKAKTAAELMSTPALTVDPETSTARVAELFHAHRINRAPVVDASGRLVGIVTRSDLLRATGPSEVAP